MRKWKLQDIVFLAFLGFLFGGVFMGAGVLYSFLVVALTPWGLSAFANEILFGLWTMAAPVAAMLVRRPGSAVLGEVLAALAEMLYGSYFGPGVLLSGFLQGLGTEAGFFVTKYRTYNGVSLFLGALGTTVISFCYEFFAFGYGAYSFSMIGGLFLTRLLSVTIFGVFLVQGILKLYDRVQRLAVS